MEFNTIKKNVEKILNELENAVVVANQCTTNKELSNNSKDTIMGSKEVCQFLGIGPATLSRWKKDGLIECIQLQRKGKVMYSMKAIEQFLKSNTIRKY
jgi:hypothetical protein